MTDAVGDWALELSQVTKDFGRVRALAGVSLRLPRGRLAALVGPNGSGKSTALKLWAGLVRPTGGVARVLGRSAEDASARAKIGYVPDAPSFPAWLTGEEFLRHMGQLSGLEGGSLEEAIERRARWAGLEAILSRRAQSYSAGQRQRLGLAQALLHEPEIVLLDEPAAGLDPGGVAALVALLEELRGEGRTVVFSSHFIPQVEAMCDHAWMLRGGCVVWEGDPRSGGGLTERFLRLEAVHGVGD